MRHRFAAELNISLSAVYKTLGKLEELTLVEIERFNFTDGKKIKLYKSRIGHAEITLEKMIMLHYTYFQIIRIKKSNHNINASNSGYQIKF